MSNPLLPAWPDVLWTVALIAFGCGVLVLWFVALNGIINSPGLSDTARAVWVLIVVLAPVLGSLVWLAMGRSTAMPVGLKPGVHSRRWR
jgi:Phospholipase_D-nuclease N-terminal